VRGGGGGEVFDTGKQLVKDDKIVPRNWGKRAPVFLERKPDIERSGSGSKGIKAQGGIEKKRPRERGALAKGP